jgi:serralysin
MSVQQELTRSRINAFFNTGFYLRQNPDVAAAGIDPLTHYEHSGWRERRDPSANFSTDAYLRHNPDVAAAGIDPLMHYLKSGAAEGRMAFIA